MLGAALVGYLVHPMRMSLRVLLGVAAVLMVAPNWQANLWSLLLALPVLVSQALAWWAARRDAPR